MYKNTETGETVSAEQMKVWADANNMSVTEYASMAGYSLVSQDEQAEAIEEVAIVPTEEVKEEGVVGQGVPATPQKDQAPTGESSLEDGQSDWSKSESGLKLAKAEAALNRINLTDEQEAEIQERANSIITTTETSYTTYGGASTRSIEVPAYHEFIADAKKELALEKNINVYEVSEKDWSERAKNLYIDQERQNILESDIEEVLEEYEKDVFGGWFSWARIKRLLRPGGGGPGALIPTSEEIEYAVGRATLDYKFEEKAKAATEDFTKTINKIDTNAQVLTTTDAALEQLEYRFNNEPSTVTQQDLDHYNKLLGTRKTTFDAYKNYFNHLEDVQVKSNKLSTIADMTQRTYNNLDVATNRITGATVRAIAGLGSVLHEFSPQQIVKRVAGIDPDAYVPMYLGGQPAIFGTEKFKEGVDHLYERVEEIENATKKRQELGQISSIEDFGEFMLDLMSEQSVNTAITLGTGGYGLVAVSAAAAGNKFHQMDLEMEHDPDLKISALQFYGAGLMYGAAEYFTEKVSLGQAKRAINYMGFGKNNFKKAYDLAGGRYSLEKFSMSKSLKNYGINVNKEGMAELGAQLINNFTDKYLLDKDISITEGLGEAYITGGLMSGLGFQAPILAGDIYKAFTPSTAQRKINDRLGRIFELRRNMQTIQTNNKLADNPQKQAALLAMQKEIDGLIIENLKDKKTSETLIDALEGNDKKALLEIEADTYRAKRGIDKINNNPNLDAKTKSNLIQETAGRVDANERVKDMILTNALESKDKARQKEIQMQTMAENNSWDSFQIVNAKTQNEAKELGDQIVNEAVKAEQITPEQGKTIKNTIKDVTEKSNANGYYLGAEFGLPMSFTIESAVTRNAAAGTIRHETAHATVLKALLDGDADVMQLVNNMESYMVKNYKGAKARFAEVEAKYPAENFTPAEIAEEKLAAVLEYVTQVDLSKDKTFTNQLLSQWNKIKKPKGKGEITTIQTGQDVFDVITSFARGFSDGKISGLAAKVMSGEVKAVQKKAKEIKTEVKKKPGATFSLPKANEFTAEDKKDLFSTTNSLFNETAGLYGLSLKLNEDGTPAFTKAEWDAVDDNTKLGIGIMIGDNFKPYVNYLMGFRRDVPRYAEFAGGIVERTSTGIEKGDDGIPFLVKSYNPEKGTKLTTHIFGQIANRLQGVINKTQGFGELTTEAAPTTPGAKQLVSKETAESEIKKSERKAKEVKKEFPKITDEVIVLDSEGKATSISKKVQDEVKRSVKVAYATTKFTAPIGTKKFRTELANAMRNKLGNLFKSIMDRGVNFNNNKKVGNKEKRVNYDSFVDANFKNVYSIMPKSTISDRFPFLMEEITNEDGTPNYMSVAEVEAYNDAIDRGAIRGKRIANKYANNRKFKKRAYSAQIKKEGTEYLKANDKATNVRNARKTSFADVIAEEAAFDVLPEVLRENGLAKEAEIAEIEKQIGRAKFSIGRMDADTRFKFDLNKDLFFDRVMSLKKLSKGNIKKVFLSTYSALDFDPKIIDGVAEQFANRLKPVSKAAESVPVPVFKEILINISNQADEALALQKLVGATRSISAIYEDKDTLLLARGAAIESMQSIIDKYGVNEGMQLIVAFGNSTFNASGSIGTFKFENGKLVTGFRKNGKPITRGGKDLFSGKEDITANLYKALNLKGKKIKEVTNKEIIFEDGTKLERKYSPVTNVTKGMLQDDYTPDTVNYKAAQEFVTSFFENFSKQDLDPNVAAALLSAFNDGTSNSLRAAAPVWGRSTVIKSDKTSDFRFEHAIPARVVLAYLYDYHVNGNKEVNVDALWNDYRVTIIPVKEMDKVLDDTGFSSITTSNYVPGETAWHNRYYNLFTRGRMPYAMVSYDGKETVGESYEQYFNEKGINPVVKADATQETVKLRTTDEALAKARGVKYSLEPKGISVYDFDDTLAFSKSQVIVKMPADKPMLDIAARRLFGETALKNKPGFLKTFDSLNEEQQAKVLQDVPGTIRKITPAEFAKSSEQLAAQGATFDFSEFNKVVKGTPGPLAPRLKKAIEKFGNKNIFVLTARPAESATAIYEFLKGIGLEIPLENITGLANGAPAAKAAWMIEKVANGYNDFYFVDDHLGNVKAVKDVLNVFDVKGKVQQARVKYSKELDAEFNSMIERQKGVEDFKEFSKAVARRRGKTKGRFKFFIPPSAEDFRGLTQYVFAGKGKQGEADQAFFEQNLMDPYFKGVAEMERARQTIKNDTKALNKMFKPVRKKINKLVPDGDYTYDAAIRVYLWNKAGYEIPGISKRDQAKLVKLIQNDAELSAYADGLLAVSKRDKWIEPGEFWDTQTTLSDLNNLTEKINRKEYIAEFIENADIIFSEKNLNKIEAVYGTNLREAIEDALYAMKNGTNRSSGANKITNAWNNWVNNSVGTIMFFNRRSALLQTISSINFINWSDNNPLKAGLAFANQPQYWKDFATIFNSDKLKQRRGGLKSDVQEQEIANAAKNTKDKAGAVISYLLKIGFTPTQIADSFAIAAGGATMYRNRINTYKKQGLDQKEAEAKAWQDFSKLSDEAQQSGDPALVSQQQRSTAGRLILSFQNTPMQYTRLMKKAAQDLINGRGDAKTHISKIVYYGAVQNIIFSALQNAAFALIPGFDDEDEDDEKRQEAQDKKAARMINGMTDSILRGTGIYGAVVATIKNTILKFLEQEEKGYKADHAYTIIEAANLAPPIGSKARKLYSAIQTNKFDKDVIKKHPWDVTIDGKFNLSPTYSIIGNVSSAVFNLPLDRALMEAQAVSEALDSRNTEFQRLALALGWRTWDVNAKNEEFDLIKTEAKAVRKKEGIEKAKKTRKKKALAKKELISKTISKFTDKDWGEYNRTPKKEKLEYIKKKAKEYNIE